MLRLEMMQVLKVLQSVRKSLNVGGLHHVRRLRHLDHHALELFVDIVEPLNVFGKLDPDVLGTHEDRLQIGPRPLHFRPSADNFSFSIFRDFLPCDDYIDHPQGLLPGRHLGEEEGDVLAGHHILDHNLVLLQRLDQLLARSHEFVT